MKKCLILTVCFLCLMATAVFASTCMEFTLDEPILNVENSTIQKNTFETRALDAAPYVKDGRTMVPVRALCEALGCDVAWDADTQTVTVSKGGSSIVLVIGSNVMLVNDMEVIIDCPAEITNSRTFLPLRAISETLGYSVYYIEPTRQIIIEDRPPICTIGETAVPYAVLESLYNTTLAQYGIADGLDADAKASLAEQCLRYIVENYKYALAAKDAGLALPSEVEQNLIANVRTSLAAIEQTTLFSPYFELSRVAELSSLYMKKVSETTSLTKAECEDVYQENYVRAKHILIMATGENDTEALLLAEELYERAMNGEDFDALITEYGEDPGMAANPDGYVFTRGEMVKEFEDMAFSLDIGAISEPVKTAYGYHIIARLPLPEDGAEETVNNARFDEELSKVWDSYPAYVQAGAYLFNANLN